MEKLKVLAVTGIRSEYDILYPILEKINSDLRFELVVAVSSAHLSDWHDFTINRIISDGFKIVDKLDSLFMTNRNVQRSKGVGVLTYALSQTVERENPDFLLVVGDREESIATAIVGNYMNKLVAHIGGGDPVFGNADDPIRMAVSKLAHIHFATTKQYAENLVKMHEDSFRVFFSGNPAYSNIINVPYKSNIEISDFLSFNLINDNYLVLIKHPLSSEENDSYEQMKITLTSLELFCVKHNFKVVGSYPNTDPGSYGILKAIKEFEGKPFIKFYSNIPRDIFVNLMRKATALIGNSSMGILEAPLYKLPVINVGNRQKGRLNAGNVEFVEHNTNDIIQSLNKACFNKEYRQFVSQIISPYGDGTASENICNELLKISPKDENWLIKKNLC